MAGPLTVGNRWSMASAENFLANCQMQFIYQTGADQSVIQFAAAFAEQPFDAPFFPQPPERNPEVDFFPAANFHFVGQRAKSLKSGCFCPACSQDNDGRKTMFEYFSMRIDRTRAADNDAQIVFRQAAFKPLSPEFHRAGTMPVDAESTVRAPDITASAVARSSSKCSRSRGLPNDFTARFDVAIFPSAVIAMFTSTNGSFEFRVLSFEFTEV